jgi:hypothetical protein
MNDNTKTVVAATNGYVLTLAFSNGETLTISAHDDLNGAIRDMAMMHGLKQKLVDAAAISRNSDTGRSATVDDKYNAVREVYDRLCAGQWNKSRGEGSATSGGLLFRALCQIYADKTPDAIKAFLDKKSPAEKAALRATPKIAAIIDTLRQPSDDVDTDAMLADLE